MSDWDDDEPIGYGKPPKYTRFTKGQSGNPNGRPKKNPNPDPSPQTPNDQVLKSILEEKIGIKEGGRLREVTKREAVRRAQFAEAVKGSPVAQREIIRDARELDKLEAARAQAEAEAAVEREAEERDRQDRLFEHFMAMKEARTEEWVQAVRAGKTEPDFPWPNPDDILIDKSQRKYRLRGPFDANSVPLYLWIRAQRDFYLAMFIEVVRRKHRNDAGALCWAVLTELSNNMLPKRWQVDAVDSVETRLLMCMTKAELQREIERRERRVKIPNTILPSREAYQVANNALRPLLKRMGYRSLAQFERAYEDTSGNPPWPMHV